MKLTPKEKLERAEKRKADKLAKEKTLKEELEKNQKPVKSITITIEWKKSRVWGSNPHATADVSFQDGTHRFEEGYTCSGCGYDKESTVIADIFNNFLKYKLYKKPIKDSSAPYGVYIWEEHKSYNGGIGTSCYNAISTYIGGMFECIAQGKTFDVFKYSE